MITSAHLRYHVGTQCNAKCKLMYIKLPTYYRITLDRCLSLCALPQSDIQAWPMSKALMTQVEGLNGMKTDHILSCFNISQHPI